MYPYRNHRVMTFSLKTKETMLGGFVLLIPILIDEWVQTGLCIELQQPPNRVHHPGWKYT